MRRSDRCGISLAVVLLVLLLMSVIGLGVAALGMQNLNHAASYRDSTGALHAAEAGVAAALLELKTDRAWSSGVPWTAMPGGQTSYSIEVTNNMAGTDSLTAADGTVIPPSCAWLVSTGLARQGGIRRGVGVMVKNVTGPFEQAIFASEGVSLGGGGQVDSFDSSAGSYEATASDSGADVVTNGTSAGVVTITGASTQVAGSITVGAGWDPATAISADENAYQGAESLEEPLPAPAVAIPAGSSLGSLSIKSPVILAPGTYDDIDVSSGAPLTLSSGVYSFRTLQLRGNASLLVDSTAGPVRVYIRGDGIESRLDLDLSGGALIQPGGDPTRLVFLLGPQATSAALTGGSEAWYGVYAPNASVTLTGGSSMYGAVSARSVELTGGSGLHYDVALRGADIDVGITYLDVVGWRRL
ncbi:MAG: hypothetical protein HY319_06340 [Armatimonadetes bacterium]|nr:hypothetical protein [Armatimonadota bacterium]